MRVAKESTNPFGRVFQGCGSGGEEEEEEEGGGGGGGELEQARSGDEQNHMWRCPGCNWRCVKPTTSALRAT
jgi:hypothetical protein